MLPKHIEENYERIVASGDRDYDQIADQADKDGAPAVAAWARAKVAAAGADVTPTDATPAPQAQRQLTIAEMRELLDKLAVAHPDLKIDHSKLKLKEELADLLGDSVAAVARKESGSSDADVDLFESYSDEDLREMLLLRQLDTDGERAELIARLQADETNEATPPEQATE